MDNNIQDQLNRVANEIAGTEEETQESLESTEEVVVDEPVDNDEADSTESNEEVPKELPEDERKQAGAFAAMRKRLKELEEENKVLKVSSSPSPTETEEKTQSSAKGSKEDEYTQLVKRLEEVESYNKKLQEQQVQSKVAYDVMELQKAYSLNQDELAEFADQLEEKGYDLTNLNMPLKDMYAAMNFNKLVAKEVERVKKEVSGTTNYEQAPSTGPKETGAKPTKAKDDLLGTLRRVASKIQ